MFCIEYDTVDPKRGYLERKRKGESWLLKCGSWDGWRESSNRIGQGMKTFYTDYRNTEEFSMWLKTLKGIGLAIVWD